MKNKKQTIIICVLAAALVLLIATCVLMVDSFDIGKNNANEKAKQSELELDIQKDQKTENAGQNSDEPASAPAQPQNTTGENATPEPPKETLQKDGGEQPGSDSSELPVDIL